MFFVLMGLIIGWWLFPLAKMIYGDWFKKELVPELDPIKELQAAHEIELRDWDEQFWKLTGVVANPDLSPHKEDTLDNFQRALYNDFGRLAANSAMRQQSFDMMAQQQLHQQNLYEADQKSSWQPLQSDYLNLLMGRTRGRH